MWTIFGILLYLIGTSQALSAGSNSKSDKASGNIENSQEFKVVNKEVPKPGKNLIQIFLRFV